MVEEILNFLGTTAGSFVEMLATLITKVFSLFATTTGSGESAVIALTDFGKLVIVPLAIAAVIWVLNWILRLFKGFKVSGSKK